MFALMMLLAATPALTVEQRLQRAADLVNKSHPEDKNGKVTNALVNGRTIVFDVILNKRSVDFAVARTEMLPLVCKDSNFLDLAAQGAQFTFNIAPRGRGQSVAVHFTSADCAPKSHPVMISSPQAYAERNLMWMRAVVADLQASLVDPYSAHVSLPFGFTPTLSTWKIWGVDTTGYFTCGAVNSRNRMGGYVGNTVFVGIVYPDGTVETTMDNPMTAGQRYGGLLLSKICEQKRQQGQLPPIDPAVKQALFG